MIRLGESFFHRDCLDVAPDLVGKIIQTNIDNLPISLRITETECYRGEDDTACHASRGRTPRTELLYAKSGTIYVYLCYGMHWLMNVITGEEGQPQGVLIRACDANMNGPGKLTRYLGINKRFNGESIADNDEIGIFSDGKEFAVKTDKRVGISYADEEAQNKQWRFISDKEINKFVGND